MREQIKAIEKIVSPYGGTDSMPAIRLFSTENGLCSFERGTIPTLKPMNTTTFWVSNKTEEWEKSKHPAPRKQYVITTKGKIKFKVSDGSTFIIEPGIILLAEDTIGEGHSWEMLYSDGWERLYMPISEGAEDYFTKEI